MNTFVIMNDLAGKDLESATIIGTAASRDCGQNNAKLLALDSLYVHVLSSLLRWLSRSQKFDWRTTLWVDCNNGNIAHISPTCSPPCFCRHCARGLYMVGSGSRSSRNIYGQLNGQCCRRSTFHHRSDKYIVQISIVLGSTAHHGHCMEILKWKG